MKIWLNVKKLFCLIFKHKWDYDGKRYEDGDDVHYKKCIICSKIEELFRN